MRIASITAWAIGAFALAGSAAASTLQVPQTYPTIQAAIDAATNGCEVVVDPGVYNEAIDFHGRQIVVRSSQGASQTVIDGTGLSRSIVTATSGETLASVLRGFALRHGAGTLLPTCVGGPGLVGGAVYVFFSGFSLEDCTFEENGPGMFAGAVLYDEGGNVRVRGCTVRFNGRPDGQGRRSDSGSGLTVSCGGTLDVADCDFQSNGPATFGGGIFNAASNLLVSRCRFSGNSAMFGGGIDTLYGSSTIESCTFDGNSSSGNGGGLHLQVTEGGRGVARNCIFRDNTAVSMGGGINLVDEPSNLGIAGEIEISSCLLVGGSSGVGGGGVCVLGAGSGHVRVVNSTIVRNGRGGGISVVSTSTMTVEVANSILRDNLGGQVGGFASVQYSNIPYRDEPTNIDADPRFTDAANRDFTLRADSPCIDAANNSWVPLTALVDLGGNPRITDGDGNGTSVVDIGAFERPSPTPDTCGAGTVDAAGAGVADVLFANGSSGGVTRTVIVPLGSLVQIALNASPSGPSPAVYLVYAWLARGTNRSPLVVNGSEVGCFVNPTPAHSGTPQPAYCLRGASVPTLACTGARMPVSPPSAPWSFSRVLNAPVTVTFQGVLRDLGSAHSSGFSVTNAVTVVAGP